MLEIKNLTKYYGEQCAVNNISMQLSPGIYGFLGPNGAGKTTLANMLVGNLIPTDGEILYDGCPISKLGSEYREKIGFMPQHQSIYDFFSGRQFLSYIAELKDIPEKEIKNEVFRVMTWVNLTEQLDIKIKHYSGGMKRRLLLAQALLGNPKFIILDEPTTGLDPKERIRMKNVISKYAMDTIVIIVTHIVPDIEYIAKEIVLFKEGKIVECGTPEQLTTSIDDKVYEICITNSELDNVQNNYQISNIRREHEHIYVRIITDEEPENFPYVKVKANLEEKYLYVFGEE
ncbi:MAG: ATP-binding cassette domain-containing protein [Clostridium sp.]|nr:ATP-binding cassette domain-containing protein [Clostridium sp.]MCM1460110.1 ATP-binding cassette domain-containing protein [Bacteroides sp.]